MGTLYKRRKRGDGTMKEFPTWWIKYHVNGRSVRESTGTTKVTVARGMLRDREGCVERGIPVNPRANRVRFEEAAQCMLDEYRANGRRSFGEALSEEFVCTWNRPSGADAWRGSRPTNSGVS